MDRTLIRVEMWVKLHPKLDPKNNFQELKSMGIGFIGGFNTPDGDITHMCRWRVYFSGPANEQITSTFAVSIHAPISPANIRGEHTITEGMAMRARVLI